MTCDAGELMTMEYEKLDTENLFSALQAMETILDFRILTDPLQDELYIFYTGVRAVLYARSDFDAIASRFAEARRARHASERSE